MDSDEKTLTPKNTEQEEEEEEEETSNNEENDHQLHNRNTKRKGVCNLVLRFSLAIGFPIWLLFILMGIVAVFDTHFSITTPMAVHSQCKIVSSGVDIRSSKVCELGLLNYKAKHVFYPYEKRKFRCRYDYYWASVFQVEYKDHTLGQTRYALAEAPAEALPLSCRPNFGTAWLTKDKFKVNETYDCWYTSGISKVRLYQDGLFSCQANDPSSVEMIRRYFVLSKSILYGNFIQMKGNTNQLASGALAGVISGFFTSFISIVFLRVLQRMKSSLSRTRAVKMVAQAIHAEFFKRACFLMAYISFIVWLIIQYAKKIGFPDIYAIYEYQ